MEFQRVRKTFPAATSALLLAMLAVTGPTGARAASGRDTKPPSTWVVRANPSKLVNGAPIFLEVTAPVRLKSLTGTWLGHEIIFDQGGARTWFALAGVS